MSLSGSTFPARLIRIFSILWLYLSIHTFVSAQNFIPEDDYLINGYNSRIYGQDYDYYSCIPGLRKSLLVRANDGTGYIEWETDSIPSGISKKYVTFSWIAALGSSPGTAQMDVTINGAFCCSFFTNGLPDWEITGNDGNRLSFHSIMVDQYGDHHGYMMLRIPREKTEAGKPLRIKVAGSASNLTSWYMTYKKPVKTGVSLHPYPAIIKEGSAQKQLVEAGIFYFGKPVDAQIYADDVRLGSFTLRAGYNSINLGLEPVLKPTEVVFRVAAGNFSTAEKITLEPVRKWKINLIQHTHTDIGYTRSQTEILSEHLRYIDYALDYCDLTDSYPDDAKFRWTCEASWPVDEYLKCRPAAQIDRLVKRVKEGRIEVTGMYYNFSELPDEQALAASLGAVGRIRTKGIPVNLAMQNDVNGIGWCMNDYFNLSGISYLNMGTHGHRALICYDMPTMFWWESPSGKRILAFRAEHYMTGNTVFEMQTGDIDKFKNNLLNYLSSLEEKEFPFNQIAIQHSGYLTDNSPPSITASHLIRKWNEIFEWPKLTTATAETFFKDMERQHGVEFPVVRGAWPDWWADGLGASAREVAVARTASASLMASKAGLSMAAVARVQLPEGINDEIFQAENSLLFYSEHTTGYSESVREPLSSPTMEQRAIKDSWAWEANRRVAMLGEESMGLLQSLFEREPMPSVLVFNPLTWKRSGLATVYIDHQLVPRGNVPGIFDAEGRQLPVQFLSARSDGTYWGIWFKDVPAFGYKKYFLKPLDIEPSTPDNTPLQTLENKWYRLTIDLNKGAISSLFDKELAMDIVDKEATWELGEFILEQLGNREQIEAKQLNNFKRLSLDTVWFDSFNKGEIWNSIRFYGETSTAVEPRGFTFEIRLFNTEKRIDLVYSLIKKNITEPESFYIAFPFAPNCGKHFTEVAGGVMESGKEQIVGSSNDWNTVQNFTSLRTSGSQVVLGSAEMPLMQFGAINTGRFRAGEMPASAQVFSWPMNNYWTTNFNADQRGGHSWSYYLTSSTDASNVFATRFGWGCRVPFLSRIIPGGGKGDNKSEGSFIYGWPENIVLISSVPLTDGSLLLHLRETDGKPTAIMLSDGLTDNPVQLFETDVNGNPLPENDLMIEPLETKFYKLVF